MIQTETAQRKAPIGVFDSGVGGLTVVREIIRNLPDERIVYFGDTARVPYGSKSRDTIIHYAKQIIHFLQTQQVKAIVIACNTASALALDTVEKELDIPILGVVKPGARTAVETTRTGRIGVIGTESTINSGLYHRYIQELDPNATVFGKACPLFCPLVEEGWLKDSVTEEVARRYLKELLEQDIDSLIMGCTHYPLLRSLLRRIVGEDISLINPAYETARELGKLLKQEGLEHPGSQILLKNPDLSEIATSEEIDKLLKSAHAPRIHQEKRQVEGIEKEDDTEKYRFYVSDSADKFRHFANTILSLGIESVQKINIEEY